MQECDRVAVFGAGPVGLLAAHSARIRGAREVFVVDQHPDATSGPGVDSGVEAVGWQAHDPTGEEHPELVLDNLVQVGTIFTKGQRMGTGQAPVKRNNRQLRDLIIAGRAVPGFLVSHEIGLDAAADGYERFDSREDGWTKALLKPGA